MSKKSLLDSVEVKTPCNEGWDKMQGNDEVRFCSHCAKSVHNISAMTRIEARKLVAQSNGNLCIRYIRRPDGQVQTVDRPLYHIGKRATRIAAGAFGAALSLSVPVYAQGKPVMVKQGETAVQKSVKGKIDAATASISGTILDSMGAVVPGTKITLTDTKSGKVFRGKSNDEGFYGFQNLAASVYQIEAEAIGFKKMTITELKIDDAQNIKKNLDFEVEGAVVGDIAIITEYKVELMQAVSISDKAQIRKLIALGKDVNEQDKSWHNQSALHIAAEMGNAEIAQMLLDAKADINITDDEGETPLMVAARDNHLELVRLLLEAGANPHLQDKAGKTVLQKAASDKIKQILKQYGTPE